jgi:hypothetical protein
LLILVDELAFKAIEDVGKLGFRDSDIVQERPAEACCEKSPMQAIRIKNLFIVDDFKIVRK